ncbi:hypothetical protein AQB9606_03946 [Aquabacterium sp. CECT 9606]|nr:hypothetical protein AQB9606_03946 [Aquabacterium sp. CECT 9606]
MSIIAIGLDLAKNVFAMHGIDEAGKTLLIKPAATCSFACYFLGYRLVAVCILNPDA